MGEVEEKWFFGFGGLFDKLDRIVIKDVRRIILLWLVAEFGFAALRQTLITLGFPLWLAMAVDVSVEFVKATVDRADISTQMPFPNMVG